MFQKTSQYRWLLGLAVLISAIVGNSRALRADWCTGIDVDPIEVSPGEGVNVTVKYVGYNGYNVARAELRNAQNELLDFAETDIDPSCYPSTACSRTLTLTVPLDGDYSSEKLPLRACGGLYRSGGFVEPAVFCQSLDLSPIAKITITTSGSSVYPFPPDGVSSGQLMAYDEYDQAISGVTWSFADAQTLGCQLTSAGVFTAGDECGTVVVEAATDGCTKTAEVDVLSGRTGCGGQGEFRIDDGHVCPLDIVRVDIVVDAPTVYPLPPDERSSGQLQAYDENDELIEDVTWWFAGTETLGCWLTEDGVFTAGDKCGSVLVEAEDCAGRTKTAEVDVLMCRSGCGGSGPFRIDDGHVCPMPTFKDVSRVDIVVEAPSVYPFPPDEKSSGQLKAYDTNGQLITGITWSFADGQTRGCQLTADGVFTAGDETGEIKVQGCGPVCLKKTVKVECGGGSCADCQKPGSGTFELDSLRMTFNLGKVGLSGSAGELSVKADVPSQALFTPASLDLGLLSEGAEVIRDSSGNLRQVYNSVQTLVDIVPNGPDEYSLSFYKPSQVGPRFPGWPEGWSGLGAGMNDTVYALAAYNGELYAGGAFTTASGQTVDYIAKWDGFSWAPLANGMDGPVYALVVYNGELCVGGSFSGAGGTTAYNIAKWDGSSWSALGDGVNGTVYALAVYDAALCVGGGFTTAGGSAASRVAQWDGSSWSPLGSGLNSHTVYDLINFDDGNDVALYAAGYSSSGYIMKWDSSSWSALGGSISDPYCSVNALAAFNGELYAGGEFDTFWGWPFLGIAKWDGSAWSQLAGAPPSCHDLTVFDDGSGLAMYAGGHFTTAGGSPANRIAKWDGLSWSALGDGLGGLQDSRVEALTDFDDGSGAALYAGGYFTTAGGQEANCIARWGTTSTGDGCYTLPGNPTPFTKYVISKREGDVNQLRVTKSIDVAGVLTPTATYDYTYDPVTTTWSLATGDGTGTAARKETLTKVDLGGGMRQETTRIYTVDGAQEILVYEEQRTYASIDCGNGASDQIVEQRIDPNGANLTTTWSYYDINDGAGRCGKTESVLNADGSWVMHDYDAEGRTTVENRSWLDDAMPATANDAGSGQRTVYDYTPIASSGDSEAAENAARPRTVTEYVHNTVVGQTFHVYATAGDRDVEIVQQDADVATGSGYGDAGNLTTTTTYYGPADGSPKDGRVYTVEYPDGRLDTYDYETGSYNEATYAFEAGTGAMRTTVTHGTTGSPTGIGGRTTREVTVTDDLGPVWLEETLVCVTSGSFASLGLTRHEYDDEGHRTATYHPNGTFTEAGWGCCYLEWETDANGIMTQYPLYDALDRVLTQVATGIDGSGNPGESGYRPSIETTYTYDAMGRQLTSTIGGTLMTQTVYQLDGRIESTTDESGLTTYYTYDDDLTDGDGRQVEVTRPGPATEITEYYRDGRVRSVTGTGVVARYYGYAVNPDGTRREQVMTGNGLDSPFESTTTTDALGRTKQIVEQPNTLDDRSLVTEHTFNALGQLERTAYKVVQGASEARIVADTLYVYDDYGQVAMSGLDVNEDDSLTAASTDRISASSSTYVLDGSDWWSVSTTTVYNDSEYQHAPIITATKRRLTGFANDIIDEMVSLDARDKPTTAVTTLDRTAKALTRIVDYFDATRGANGDDEVTITLNGLVQSATSKTGVTTTYGYDALGRRTHVWDARKPYPTITQYDPNTGRVSLVRVQTGPSTWLATAYTYDGVGRTASITNPENEIQYFAYTLRGELWRTRGSAVYPVQYSYDDYGRRTSISTFRAGNGWDGPDWPANPGEADLTEFWYGMENSSRWLTDRVYADGTSIHYMHSVDGKIETRTWARTNGGTPLVTTYDYYDDSGEPLTGELQSVTYTGSTTPGVTYDYDRLGRHKVITQDNPDPTPDTTWTIAYTEYGEPAGETIAGLYNETITRSYEGDTVVGRSSGLTIGAEYEVIYGYDEVTGRLDRINGPGLPSGAGGAFYGYTADSDLVGSLTYKDTSGTAVASATRAYDGHRDLITVVENNRITGPAATISKYTYAYDNVGRRMSVVTEGEAFSYAAPGRFNVWGYNDRGELTSSHRGEGTTVVDPPSPEVTAERRLYAYDPIGNRAESTTGTAAALHYCANSINQYTATGAAAGCASASERLTYDADGNLTSFGLVAADFDADGDVDMTDFGVFSACFNGPNRPPTPGCTNPATDIDGDGDVDMADYGVFNACFNGPGRRPACADASAVRLTWDGENRLASVEPMTPVDGSVKTEYAYDYMGRRVRKTVSTYASGAWVEEADGDRLFVYDGWNVVLELDANAGNATVRKFTWGLDLSGTRQGAGGIGGLLATVETHGTTATEDDDAYWYLYDANGNVGQVIDASDKSIAARYEYDPYGNTIVAEGPYAAENPFRFSTKWYDAETGLYYYGYRYYDPRLGRWTSRDPINEPGAILVRQAPRPAASIIPRDRIGGSQDRNHYRFVDNSSTNHVDPHGLLPLVRPGEVRWNIILEPGDRYFRRVSAWLDASIVVNGVVNARLLRDACCPAIGVVQIVHENYNNGGYGAWELDTTDSKILPFYAHSTPMPPAFSLAFSFRDGPGWNPPGDYSDDTFAQEFKTCVFCAMKVSGKWKVRSSLSCINWGYNYSKNSAPPPAHIVNLWVRGCSLVSGPPVEAPRAPFLRTATPYAPQYDVDVEALIIPYR